MKQYAFFLDIDGTLYTGDVPECNRKAIQTVRHAGHLVFINTARPYYTIPLQVRALELDGFICALGSSIFMEDVCVFSRSAPVQTVAQVFDVMNENGDQFVIEAEEWMLCNPSFAKDLEYMDVYVVQNGADLIQTYGDYKMAKFFVKGQMSAPAREQIEQICRVLQHRNYAEFVLTDTSKASGIDTIAAKYGIPLERCVAMGDSINDMEMLLHSGISVAMGDASESVRDVCDMITCNAKDGGVAEALLRITGLEQTY